MKTNLLLADKTKDHIREFPSWLKIEYLRVLVSTEPK